MQLQTDLHQEHTRIIVKQDADRIFELRLKKFEAPACQREGHEYNRLNKICLNNSCTEKLFFEPLCQQCIYYNKKHYGCDIGRIVPIVQQLGKELTLTRDSTYTQNTAVKQIHENKFEEIVQKYLSLEQSLLTLAKNIREKLEWLKMVAIEQPKQESKRILKSILEERQGDVFVHEFRKLANYVHFISKTEILVRETLDLNEWDLDRSVDAYYDRLRISYEEIATKLRSLQNDPEYGFEKILSQNETEEGAEGRQGTQESAKKATEQSILQKDQEENAHSEHVHSDEESVLSFQNDDYDDNSKGVEDKAQELKREKLTEEIKRAIKLAKKGCAWSFERQEPEANTLDVRLPGYVYEGSGANGFYDLVVSQKAFSEGVHTMKLQVESFNLRKGSVLVGIITDAHWRTKTPVLYYGCSKCLFTETESQMYCENNHKNIGEVLREGDIVTCTLNLKQQQFLVSCRTQRGERTYRALPELFTLRNGAYRFVVWWKNDSRCRIKLVESD